MFRKGGVGEENGNGLSAVCSSFFCLLSFQLKDCGIYICFLVSKKTNRKFLLSRHSLHRHYKIRIIRECTKRLWANFFFLFGKKMNPSKKTLGYSYSHILVLPVLSICLRYPMILYDVKVSWIQVFFCLIVY